MCICLQLIWHTLHDLVGACKEVSRKGGQAIKVRRGNRPVTVDLPLYFPVLSIHGNGTYRKAHLLLVRRDGK